MRKIVKVLFLVVIAVLLGVVASVDVDAKVVEVVPQVPEQPAAVKDTCIKDCSRCEIDCIYEREDAMDSTADAVVGDEFEHVPGSDEFETVSNDEFEDVSGSTEFEQAACVEEVVAEPLVNKSNKRLLVVVLSLFLATALAGIFVEYPKLRNLRYFFLLLSLVVAGFGFGGNCSSLIFTR